jgi:hypothetical protein
LKLPRAGAGAAAVDRPLAEVWLDGSEQALRLVAGQALSRSPLGKAKLPKLLQALDDSEPINRVFALKAVERVRGVRLDPDAYQLTATPAERRRQINHLLEELPAGFESWRPSPR